VVGTEGQGDWRVSAEVEAELLFCSQYRNDVQGS
jgi:hypothetical protein